MTTLRTDLAKRLRARSKHVFGWGIGVVALDGGLFRLTAYNPRNKKEKEVQVIPVNLEDYAEVYPKEDERDIFIDTIIRSFLFPTRVVGLLPEE